MNNLKFSIIIPNYNKGKLIKKCLDSIYNQTLSQSEYEVITIDDGSDDESLDIIKTYNNYILLYSNREYAGGARNKGFDVAKGEYIILLDSDDFFTDTTVLEKLKNQLNDEDVVFVRYIENKAGTINYISENEESNLNELIYKSKYFCCTLKCFKRELISDIRYKERCFHEDISFVIELMCKARSALFFKENLYVHYKPGNNSTVDNYTIKKATDFYTQMISYFYLADKYPNKKEFILNRIKIDNYYKKIDHLYDWIKNNNPYSYKDF